MKGLSKYVDGEHYFDTLADQVVFEFASNGYRLNGWRPPAPPPYVAGSLVLWRVND
jgi:hypothetical protein